MQSVLPVNKLKGKKGSLLHDAAVKVFPFLQQRKTQSFITISLTLIGLIILGLFAIQPTVATILDLRKEIDDNRIVLQNLQQKISHLTSLQQQYDDLQPDLPRVIDAIPDTHNLPKLLGQIQSLLRQNNLQITSLQSDALTIPIATVDTTSSFTFTFEATGQRANVMSFITAFMNFERLVTLNEVSISSIPAQNGADTAVLIQGKAFFKHLQ